MVVAVHCRKKPIFNRSRTKTDFESVAVFPYTLTCPQTRCGAGPFSATEGGALDSAMVPPKNLDLVPKHVLLINEQHYAMAELQLRNNELQKENQLLRLLQLGQQKRLERYESKDGEQLLTRHSAEMQALRKQLRQAQERGCEAERSLKETQEQLHRSQAAVGRLRKLAEQLKRGPREELRLQLEQEKTNNLENQRKIKELERRIELGCISHQRQLAAEKKKTLSSQTVVRVQQDDLKSLSNELKEKDCELETLKTIYGANRMPKQKKELAVLTAYNKLCLGFPTPALPNTPDVYFSQKELDDLNRRPQVTEEKKKNQLAGVGRRRIRAQPEDLVFGSYSPSFGRPASRGHSLLSPHK